MEIQGFGGERGGIKEGGDERLAVGGESHGGGSTTAPPEMVVVVFFKLKKAKSKSSCDFIGERKSCVIYTSARFDEMKPLILGLLREFTIMDMPYCLESLDNHILFSLFRH